MATSTLSKVLSLLEPYTDPWFYLHRIEVSITEKNISLLDYDISFLFPLKEKTHCTVSKVVANKNKVGF